MNYSWKINSNADFAIVKQSKLQKVFTTENNLESG